MPSRPVTSAVLAPFFALHQPNNRPRLFAEVLADFGPVDVYTTRFDHWSKTVRPDEQVAPFRRIEYVPSPAYGHNVGVDRLFSQEVYAARAAAAFFRRRKEYDLVYVTAPHSELALFAFGVSRSRIKVLDVIDIWPDVLPFSDRFKRRAAPALKLWRGLFDRAVGASDAVVAVSDHFLDEALPHFRGDLDKARRFYICSEPLPDTTVPKQDRLTIVYVGSIGHLYDFDALIEAASHPSVRGSVEVFIVGDGDRRADVLEALEARGVPTTYFGTVYDPHQLADIFGRCHVGFNGYVNTTAAFSYKANTYFGAGLPVFNSMGGDLWSLVERKGLGVNYAQGSAPELLAAIQTVLRDGLGDRPANVASFFESELSHVVVREQIHAFVDGLLRDDSAGTRR